MTTARAKTTVLQVAVEDTSAAETSCKLLLGAFGALKTIVRFAENADDGEIQECVDWSSLANLLEAVESELHDGPFDKFHSAIVTQRNRDEQSRADGSAGGAR